jgi:Leucine-rich repeat (LRR) protein
MSIPPKRRRFRFSLRTLMLALTVFGIWLGIETDRALKQRRAVEMVRKFGGMVGYRHQRIGTSNWDSSVEPWAPRWLRQIMGEDYFVSVFEVYLANYGNPVDPPMGVLQRLTDDDIGCLAGLRRIERLDLARAPVTAQGLAHLVGLQNLEYLDLRDTIITDQHLEQLGRLRHLKDLRLGTHSNASPALASQITDQGISHLKHLTQLDTLFLDDLPITDEGLAHLTGLTNLHDLSLRRTRVTDAGLKP